MPKRKLQSPQPSQSPSQPQTVEAVLHQTYYDPKQAGSFGGVESLVQAVHKRLGGVQSLKYIRKRAQDWLKTQDTYTLHKPLRRRFPRNRTVVYGIDDQWQADLVEMREWQRENNNYAYILTCIDIFSKYAWVRPVKRKTAEDVCQAFESIFTASDRTPNKLQTDKGKEFLNRQVQGLFKHYGIHHFTSQNETKAGVVERFNRTLKSKMWRYFTEMGNHHYLDALQELVTSYNLTRHRSIGMAPSQVTEGNERLVWNRLYKTSQLLLPLKFAKGTLVRLSKFKWPFDKGYLPNWTDEVFVVVQCIQRRPRNVYKITDSEGEEVTGLFYEEELQAVNKNLADDEFEVEEVLKERINSSTGLREAFVKWKGWPSKFNSWVPWQNG
jgi:transposase InsO family protein